MIKNFLLPDHKLKILLIVFVDYYASGEYRTFSDYIQFLPNGLNLRLTNKKYSDFLLGLKLKHYSTDKYEEVHSKLIFRDSEGLFYQVKSKIIDNLHKNPLTYIICII